MLILRQHKKMCLQIIILKEKGTFIYFFWGGGSNNFKGADIVKVLNFKIRTPPLGQKLLILQPKLKHSVSTAHGWGNSFITNLLESAK